jgi:hypothetical protein
MSKTIVHSGSVDEDSSCCAVEGRGNGTISVREWDRVEHIDGLIPECRKEIASTSSTSPFVLESSALFQKDRGNGGNEGTSLVNQLL